ncbi:hypothetical protein QN277_027981 [Acacia crassicarpa]|uniref:Reverse transcriptase domain-containing protein n=1 Tax=Acacia crassicarpa TaxID=499986 RepID=A0AAE1MEP3_9FABA|nr:hypothetical protein QN277_027981 [Acacia crassicarpa]
MTNIVAWNCRGACSSDFAHQIRLLCRNSNPCLVFLSETKSASVAHFRALEKLGFDGLHLVPSIGRSAGLAVAWKKDRISVSVLNSDRQFIHLSCSVSGMPLFLLTAVYSVPISCLKGRLWADLFRLSTESSNPWAVIGDFNDILHVDERSGGADANLFRMRLFHDRIFACGLSDMGFCGPKFTWRGPKNGNHLRLFERLDRALANTNFLSCFSECYLQVLPRTTFSDHNPLCLCFGNNSGLQAGGKPFRFEAMWLTHDNYGEFLSNNWPAEDEINSALSRFKDSVEIWNKDIFGFVEKKIHIIMRRLGGIQKSRNYPHSPFLCNLEKELQVDLHRLLKLEEIKWFQKSRSEWISKGDRNTRYYHLKSKMRRRRNRITSLKSLEGSWVSNESDLKHMVVCYFKSMYLDDSHSPSNLSTLSSFPSIDRATAGNMASIPSDDEIKQAVFSMGNYKAPGIDGFPPIFYKNNWATVGPSLCAFVKKVFQGSISVEESNKTLIALIPKRNNPELVTHFRPISLCTVHYKCVAKIITHRLKGVINELVSPFQASFIQGRHIQDNIIIGQELLHIMSRNRSRRGLMAMKIDLEKAYDRIRWEFLQQVLIEAGFEDDFIHLIIHCVSSVSFNVIWNGSQTEFFCPQRGLRQGDPISPLLFVLCMDKLSHVICDAVDDGSWKPMATSKQGPKVSHLMFADDLLLFGVATEAQAACMMDCLDVFSKASGAKVNPTKSSIFFSPKVSNLSKQIIKDVTHMKVSSDIGKYLGFPLSRNRRKKDTFNYIIERVRNKLSAWKVNCLSTAGRITIAKSVLSSIPLYPMQVARIPRSICLQVERLQRNFIWGHDESQHKFHPVGWDSITRPKDFGGLGLRRLSSFNQACGAKLAWKLVVGAKGLWADVLQSRYMLRDDDSLLTSRPGDSTLWRFIASHREIVDKGAKWQIRNGRTVKFFTDAWLLQGFYISDFCNRPLSPEEINSHVADWVSNGSWDFSRLDGCVLPSIIQKLMAVLPPRAGSGNDLLVWGASNDGVFSIRSTYFMIEPNPPQTSFPLSKVIWSWKGAERIKVFMWMASLNRLPTNVRRSYWAPTSALCTTCNAAAEDTLHILRDCPFASRMWTSLISPRFVSAFFSAGLSDWFALNLKNSLGRNMGSSWHIIFGVGVWKLWNWRNLSIFETGFVRPPNPATIIMSSWRSFAMFPELICTVTASSRTVLPSVCWCRPPENWAKLNVDGAVSLRTSLAGCGGVVRNHHGEWIAGFAKSIGVCNSYMAEEWAIYEGLNSAWDLGLRKVVVESDAGDLVTNLLNLDSSTGSLLAIRIKELLAREWTVVLCHVNRECNRIADALAKIGLSKSVILGECPMFLREWVDCECLGLISPML